MGREPEDVVCVQGLEGYCSSLKWKILMSLSLSDQLYVYGVSPRDAQAGGTDSADGREPASRMSDGDDSL